MPARGCVCSGTRDATSVERWHAPVRAAGIRQNLTSSGSDSDKLPIKSSPRLPVGEKARCERRLQDRSRRRPDRFPTASRQQPRQSHRRPHVSRPPLTPELPDADRRDVRGRRAGFHRHDVDPAREAAGHEWPHRSRWDSRGSSRDRSASRCPPSSAPPRTSSVARSASSFRNISETSSSRVCRVRFTT